MKETQLKHLRKGEMRSIAHDRKEALRRFQIEAQKAAFSGDYSIDFYHPLYAECLYNKHHYDPSKWVTPPEQFHEDTIDAFNTFVTTLERDGFKVHPSELELRYIHISWL